MPTFRLLRRRPRHIHRHRWLARRTRRVRPWPFRRIVQAAILAAIIFVLTEAVADVAAELLVHNPTVRTWLLLGGVPVLLGLLVWPYRRHIFGRRFMAQPLWWQLELYLVVVAVVFLALSFLQTKVRTALYAPGTYGEQPHNRYVRSTPLDRGLLVEFGTQYSRVVGYQIAIAPVEAFDKERTSAYVAAPGLRSVPPETEQFSPGGTVAIFSGDESEVGFATVSGIIDPKHSLYIRIDNDTPLHPKACYFRSLFDEGTVRCAYETP